MGKLRLRGEKKTKRWDDGMPEFPPDAVWCLLIGQADEICAKAFESLRSEIARRGSPFVEWTEESDSAAKGVIAVLAVTGTQKNLRYSFESLKIPRERWGTPFVYARSNVTGSGFMAVGRSAQDAFITCEELLKLHAGHRS